MGTSSACMWATIYFATHDMGTLIPTDPNLQTQSTHFSTLYRQHDWNLDRNRQGI